MHLTKSREPGAHQPEAPGFTGRRTQEHPMTSALALLRRIVTPHRIPAPASPRAVREKPRDLPSSTDKRKALNERAMERRLSITV